MGQGVIVSPSTALLRNKIFDPYRTLVAARHSGQGRRPRPGIQFPLLDSGFRRNDARRGSLCFCLRAECAALWATQDKLREAIFFDGLAASPLARGA